MTYWYRGWCVGVGVGVGVGGGNVKLLFNKKIDTGLRIRPDDI